MLDWLATSADSLVGQAPGWRRSCSPRRSPHPAGSARHGWLASRLADALYRTGDRAAAERVAERALGHATDPDLVVDLHWTLAQCRMLVGLGRRVLRRRSSGRSPRPGSRPSTAPGCSCSPRAPTCTSATSTRPAGRPTSALASAAEADDTWATGWALHVLAGHGHDPGRPGRRAAALRSGSRRDRDRPRADRPRAAAAGQQGRHALQPQPVRRGAGHGGAGPAARGPGRHRDPAGAGARHPRPAVLRDRALGRRAGRDRDRADGPEGARRGLRRARHRRRDQLPPERAGRGPPLPGRRRAARGSGSGSARSRRCSSPGRSTASRPETSPRRSPSSPPRSTATPTTSERPRTCSADAVRLALKTGDKATAQTLAGAGRHARRGVADPAPAGQRALLPGPGRPGRRRAARGRAAVRRRRAAAPPGQGPGGGGRVPGRGRGADRRAAGVRAGRRGVRVPRGRGRPEPGPRRVPGLRDQARAAQQAPAGGQRLGLADRRRAQGRGASSRRGCPTRRSPPG